MLGDHAGGDLQHEAANLLAHGHIVGFLDLRLNTDKTHVVDAGEQGFDFLGFSICRRTSRRSGKRYPHTEPSKRSQQRIKQRVTELTARRRTPVPLPVLVNEVNQALRGWSGQVERIFRDHNVFK